MIVQIQKAGIWGSKFWRQPVQITVNHRTIHGSKWAMFNSNVLNAQRRIHLDPVRSPCFMMKSHQNPIFWYFSWQNPIRIPFFDIFHGEIPSKSHQNPIFSYFSWRNPIRIPSESPWILHNFPSPRPRILQEALRLHFFTAQGHQGAQEVHQAWNPQISEKMVDL